MSSSQGKLVIDREWLKREGERKSSREAGYSEIEELLGELETQLGLAISPLKEVLRAVRLLDRLNAEDAFWAESAAKDPLATALRLLQWNEELRLAGWRGQAASPRLGQLAELVQGSAPGMAERTARVIEALKVQEIDLDSIEILGMSRSELPVLFRRLLDALEAKGTVITETPIEPATGEGDLAGCMQEGYLPAGTGELRMIRPHGPLAAADLVSALLATLDNLEGTVVIGGDEILDNALHKFGLPTLGVDRAPGGDPLLQILPLVIALGWLPQDPHLALELLSLPESPVPPSIAGGLVRALRQWPAIGSDDWNRVLMLGVESIPDPERKKRIVERLGILLKLTASGNEFPASDMDRRVGALETWAKGKAKADEAQTARWECLLQQLASFRRLYQATGLSSLARPLVEKLIKAATEQVVLPPVRIAEAGIESVSEPGAILAPARRIVWWNFTERRAPSVERSMLTPEEKTALEALGCEFPDPAVQAAQFSRAWRRPLQMATDSVLLVCPKFGADGEPEAPHPLWDEISSRLGSEQVAKLVGELPPEVERNHEVPALVMPVPRREWRVDPAVTITKADHFSPSSLELLLGNPLYWVLKYPGRLSYGASDPLPSGVLTTGSLAHKIAGDLLAECTKKTLHDPGHAAELAGRRFDDYGPSMTADFFMPGRESERSRLRHTIIGLTRDLFSHLHEAGATVAAVETDIERKIDGISFRGRPDLVLSNPDIVLDMKWGREGDRRKELEEGGALQLSIYVALLKRPHFIGYYISSRQRLLLCNPGRFDCIRIEGPAPSEVWDAARVALKERLDQLRRGIVEDTCALVDGNAPPDKSCLVEGRLVIAPKPEYVPFAWISGTAQA
jgi:ATP-dependent helicase/nuclease subunit B